MEHSDRAKKPPSVVVGIGTRSPVIEEVGGIKRRIDGSEGDRSLVEVETIGKVVSRGVGIAQRRQGESLFDEFEDAAEIVGNVGDVSSFVVGRDDAQGHAEAVFEAVVVLSSNVTSPAAPILPHAS